MIAAVLSTILLGTSEKPTVLSRVVTRIAESRARSAAQQLRRHEAYIQDRSRRQDHSALFLDQGEPLPAKI